ncbi:MAG TPA: ABC transporter ATP-binding protein [Gaiellaceae bacterium]|nr:ABC transporter ATP-binding protein [Gaiellaceae bacterium]
MAAAVEFENVTKHYRGATAPTVLREELAHRTARLLRREGTARRPVVRALDGVSFEIPQGESFAILGANGAGKTTALKLATRIAYPTTGTIRVRGRVGALIEVGTGMHPELTGRENVALYGRILGLGRRDVEARFDEIVEFAGIGAAIDQPVKQYSSGMQLRLGFSVAAHLEPDVLIVDEAIAVGDAGFQYRCVERMARLVREGRTLVFVSHNTSAVETLCQRAILLRGGRVALDGPAPEVVAAYLDSFAEERLGGDGDGAAAGTHLEILRTTLHDGAGREVAEVRSGEALTVRLHYRARAPLAHPIVNVGLVDPRIGCFSIASMLRDGGSPEVLAGEGTIDCTFAALPLLPRAYEIWAGGRGERGFGAILEWQRLRTFRVVDPRERAGKGSVSVAMNSAPVEIPYRWTFGSRDGDGA